MSLTSQHDGQPQQQCLFADLPCRPNGPSRSVRPTRTRSVISPWSSG